MASDLGINNWLFVVLEVHCGIYKSFCNISNTSKLNSFSFMLSPSFWNNFNRSHFSIFIHVYTKLAPYSLSYTLSPHPLPLLLIPTLQTGPVLPSYFLILWKKKKWHFCLFRIALQGVSCDISMYVCIITRIGSPPLFFSFLS
jgi:hypothetical protein